MPVRFIEWHWKRWRFWFWGRLTSFAFDRQLAAIRARNQIMCRVKEERSREESA